MPTRIYMQKRQRCGKDGAHDFTAGFCFSKLWVRNVISEPKALTPYNFLSNTLVGKGRSTI